MNRGTADSTERKKLAREETPVKRPLVGVSLGYPLYDEVKAAASAEPVRSMAAFVLEVFRYGWGVYQRVGDLKALKNMGRDPIPRRRKEFRKKPTRS